MKWVWGLGVFVAAFAMNACASFSTAPEAANQRVRQLCNVRDASWVQIPTPENAQIYRDAWSQAADGNAYIAPHWPEDEFWFRNVAGQTRLCAGNPFYREERCSAGTTVDFTENVNGLVASNYLEPICLT